MFKTLPYAQDGKYGIGSMNTEGCQQKIVPLTVELCFWHRW